MKPLVLNVISITLSSLYLSLCDSAHITRGSVSYPLAHHRSDPQPLYLTHWAETKCFLIIHLITQRATIWGRGHSATAATALLSTNVWTHQGLFELSTTRPSRWAKGQKRSERQIEEKCKHNREEYKEKAGVFPCCGSWWFIAHVFISPVPHKASLSISQNMYCSLPLTEKHRHGGRGWIAMDGFERGGPERHAACSVCAHCAAFMGCQTGCRHESWMNTTMRGFPSWWGIILLLGYVCNGDEYEGLLQNM